MAKKKKEPKPFVRQNPRETKKAKKETEAGFNKGAKASVRRTVTVGGQEVTVNTRTGVVRDASGNIIIGATYDPATGAVTVGGQVADVTPRRTPIAGQTYERNFTDTTRWTTAIDPATGETYYVNKRNGNVFTTTGMFAGTYKNGQFKFFDNGQPGTPEGPGEPEEIPEDAPPKPVLPPELEGEGWSYTWDGEQWILSRSVTAEDEAEKGALRAQLRGWINDNFPEELAHQAFAWVESIITEGRPGGYDQIILELQQQQFFRDAYPELEMRRLRGLGNVPLNYIRSYRQEAKRIAQENFSVSITDKQIALLIGSNTSIDEFAHRLDTYRKVQKVGGPVRAFFEEAVGVNLSDEELYEWFDSEIDTHELNKAYDEARLRGVPVLFGLNPRSKAESDALQALMEGTGLTIEEVIRRMETVGQNAPLFQRLGAIEAPLLEGLPDNFGEFMKDIPNELLWQAEVWQNPFARAMIQNLTAREAARWRTGGGVATQGGQAVGLLTAAERASFG